MDAVHARSTGRLGLRASLGSVFGTGRVSTGSSARRVGSRVGGLAPLASEGLAAGEVLRKTGLLAVGVLLSSLGAAITLVAFGSALSGLNDLGLVGTSDAHAARLASHVGGVTLGEADLGSGLGGGRAGRGAGDGAGLVLGDSSNTQGEGEEDGRVLHDGCLEIGREDWDEKGMEPN